MVKEPKKDLEKEMFELEQELDIPSHLRWYNSKTKQETLEEAAEKLYPKAKSQVIDFANELRKEGFLKGVKWQSDRMYSEEEVRKAIDYGAELGLNGDIGNSFQWKNKQNKWFEQYKKK